jgi:hypothetical protein
MLRLIYILAASHSGSTLLSMLLNSHPQIITTGELKLSSGAIGDTSRYRCSCGQFVNQCIYWQKIKESMRSRGFEFDIGNACMDYRAMDSGFVRRLLRPLHRGFVLESLRDYALKLSPVWRKQLPEIQKRITALISTVLETSRAEVVVDSSKTDLRLKYLLRNPELDIKVIRLIRDGRGVALTYMNPAEFADASSPNRRAGGTGGDRDSERLTMSQAVREWKRSNEAAQNVLRRLDASSRIEIHYEQLCRDSESTLKCLFKFIGLNPDTYNKDFRSVEHHVIGNGMRLDNTSEISLDERWKSVLTKKDLNIFEETAGNMNRNFGYG